LLNSHRPAVSMMMEGVRVIVTGVKALGTSRLVGL